MQSKIAKYSSNTSRKLVGEEATTVVLIISSIKKADKTAKKRLSSKHIISRESAKNTSVHVASIGLAFN